MSNGPFEQPSFQQEPSQVGEPATNVESVMPSFLQEIQRIKGKELSDDEVFYYRYRLEDLVSIAHTLGTPQVAAATYRTAAAIIASHGNEYQWDEVPLAN
jgi:hypothetical protein